MDQEAAAPLSTLRVLVEPQSAARLRARASVAGFFEGTRLDKEIALAERVQFEGCGALLSDYGGGVAVLKKAEPWMFAGLAVSKQFGKTGLPNAGVAFDGGRRLNGGARLPSPVEKGDEWRRRIPIAPPHDNASVIDEMCPGAWSRDG